MFCRNGMHAILVCPLVVFLSCVLLLPRAVNAQEATADYRLPVKTIADGRLTVSVGQYSGVVPIYTSSDWTIPQPEVTRALVVLHGRLRNADEYYAGAQQTIAAAGEAGKNAFLVVPQFLAHRDCIAHHLDHDVIHWPLSEWMGGDDASASMRVSSFDVIDAILARLSDRTVFPNLRTVVLAGHSGGGQLLQRYAAVARGDAPLLSAGIRIKWIVSNPSTYLYFTADRPTKTGQFAPFDASQCPLFNLWKYGVDHPPRYVSGSPDQLEKAYLRRDITYLLGGADNDPNLEALDKSCAAEAQGDSHLTRGINYVHYLQFRHPQIAQKLLIVPDVGHDANKMFSSPMGLSVIFDLPAPK
jgi:pimeloyl-ACP methyl ester carboxylesterase